MGCVPRAGRKQSREPWHSQNIVENLTVAAETIGSALFSEEGRPRRIFFCLRTLPALSGMGRRTDKGSKEKSAVQQKVTSKKGL